MNHLLELTDVYMRFGAQEVLSGISLCVAQGSIYGFIGQNGAGKTTAMKLILGLLAPEKGQIAVCGEAVRCGNTRTNRHIGYLPDVPAFYPYMTAPEYLSLCAKITGLSRSDAQTRSKKLLALVGLEKFAKKKLGGYSRGMTQRLGIAQALLHEPKLLICDEPTAALDPAGRKEILDILLAVREQTTVLFSTHILTDVERICDRVAVLHDGKIRRDGSLREWQNTQSAVLEAVFAPEQDLRPLLDVLRPHAQIQAENGQLHLRAADLSAVQRLLFAQAAALDILPQQVALAQPSLEQLFLQTISQKEEASA